MENDAVDAPIRKLNGANMDIDLATPGGALPGSRMRAPGMRSRGRWHIAVRWRTYRSARTSAGSSIWIRCCVVIRV